MQLNCFLQSKHFKLTQIPWNYTQACIHLFTEQPLVCQALCFDGGQGLLESVIQWAPAALPYLPPFQRAILAVTSTAKLLAHYSNDIEPIQKLRPGHFPNTFTITALHTISLNAQQHIKVGNQRQYRLKDRKSN